MSFRTSTAVLLAVVLCLATAVFSVMAMETGRPASATPLGENAIQTPGDTKEAVIDLDSGGLRLDVGDPVDPDEVLIAAADYLKAMQADVTDDNAGNGTDGFDETPDDPDDAGWDWRVTSPPAPFHHTTAASSSNLYGATGQGLYYAYLLTSDATYFTALTDAADVMIADPGIRSGADLKFLLNYNTLPGVSGTAYKDAAKAKFDARIATYGSAQALAEYIRDFRGISNGYPNGIIAWDIGIWAVVAAMLENEYPSDPYDYAAAGVAIAEVIYQDSFNDTPGYFDIDDDDGWDPTYSDVNFYWYNLGITGLIDAFDATGVHTVEIPGLISRLLDGQYASGAISYCYGANTDDEDWQSTAYAATTLASYDQAAYQNEINAMCYWLGITQDASGGFVYSSGNHYPEVCGEIAAALYFGEAPTVTPEPPTPGCVSTIDPCIVVPFNISRTDDEDIRGYSVTFTISSELALCNGSVFTDIQQGTYLNSVAGTHYEVTNNGAGSYTVDCAILGGTCGATDPTGTLFSVNLTASGADGIGTIAINNILLRNCTNGAITSSFGGPAAITVDTAGPVAVTDVLSVQEKSGNGSDGRTNITVSFTEPGDANEVEVWRAPYGDYPEYDDGTGTVPTAPSYSDPPPTPWVKTTLNATGQSDKPPTRDFWYYVVFTKDNCGNISAISNMTGGTLNYHLGDISPSPTGDNEVKTADISGLSATYGLSHGDGGYSNYADVGPTTNFTVDARPTTDNIINFEDLMMFAINFNTVSFTGGSQLAEVPKGGLKPASLALQMDQHSLLPGSDIQVRLLLSDNTIEVKGIHTQIDFDSATLELLGIEEGSLLSEQGSMIFFKDLPADKGVVIDAAVLGEGEALNGSGEVAILYFRVRTPGARPSLSVAELRGRWNQPLGISETALEAKEDGDVRPLAIGSECRFLGARPNPFGGATVVMFDLPAADQVALKIYDVKGRLVRTLADGVLAAGRHNVTWDGRGNDGRKVGGGMYLCTFQTTSQQASGKLFRVN
ncbi:MAG: hypothetical protein KJ927_18375 [Candidatus Eisenbacteria bacterium]|nr:hypothetical protein [Candidatus Eisenbacteria bacterium]